MRPTKPMSRPPGAVWRSARKSSPSSPDSPTARWPWRPSRSTMSLLTLPIRTIFATSTVAWLDTRRPSTNSPVGRVGPAQACADPAREPEPVHVVRDLGTAAVHDDRVEPDVLEQHDVSREVLAQGAVLHRRAAVLDDDRLGVEVADVGQRL